MSNRQYSIYDISSNGTRHRKMINKTKRNKRNKRMTYKNNLFSFSKNKNNINKTLKRKNFNLAKKKSYYNKILNRHNIKSVGLNENRNTIKYRKIKRNLLKSVKFDINKPYFLNFKFDSVDILSTPDDSASNSIVYKLKVGSKQFILKITGMKTKMGALSPPDTEKKMYELMNILLDRKITPHVFTLIMSTESDIPINSLEPNFYRSLNSIFKNPKIKFVYPMITETSDSSKKIITLNDLVKKTFIMLSESVKTKIFVNILFQIMYTLEVFNRIGIKHNDLHSKNVFIQINQKNIIDGNHELYNNKYIGDREYLIPNIGIVVRIFDFDRSCKLDNGIYPEFSFIESKYVRDELYKINVNCSKNTSFDTYKILGELYLNLSKEIELKYIIMSFFHNIEILINSEFVHDRIIYKDLVTKGHRYYLMNRPIPESIMKSTNQIMDELGSMIHKIENIDINDEVYEEYSMMNI